jgi:hypothetical protein
MGTYSERAWKYVVLKSAVPRKDTAEKMGLLNPTLLQLLLPSRKKHAVVVAEGMELAVTPPYVLPSA